MSISLPWPGYIARIGMTARPPRSRKSPANPRSPSKSSSLGEATCSPSDVRQQRSGRCVVILGASVAAEVVDAGAVLAVRAIDARYDVHVVIGAGLDVEVLEADHVATVDASVDGDGAAGSVVDAPEAACSNERGHRGRRGRRFSGGRLRVRVDAGLGRWDRIGAES